MHIIYKNNSKIELNVKPKVIKLIKENIVDNLFDLSDQVLSDRYLYLESIENSYDSIIKRPKNN